jgi:hypothetical protein
MMISNKPEDKQMPESSFEGEVRANANYPKKEGLF